MQNIDTYTHVRGESIYLDDIPELAGTLYAAVLGSPMAHAKILKLDTSLAEKLDGVVKVITSKDIPGKNQIGGAIPDELLLAEDEVHFEGMPVAMVVATSATIAKKAVKLIKFEGQLLEVITDPRVAAAKNQLILPPRTFSLGDSEKAFATCEYVIEGVADNNGQEHLYIETQGAYAIPLENKKFRIYSSTQGPTAVQTHMADVLGVPMHKLEIDVTRLGGGFGGKEDQATAWAVFCALGAYLTGKPVKYSLDRMEDIRMTGKRHPYSTDYKIGLSKDLKILAYAATFHQNAGAAADLSPAVLERTLFHATNSYYIPNVKVTAKSCRTNLLPNTAFRGFGGPQGMFVIECAIAKAAESLGIEAAEIQKRNLINTGDEFPYGQKAVSEAHACWDDVAKEKLTETRNRINVFNAQHSLYKKGLSMMPICFGISFTKIPLNQARALVHVYLDGSVHVSTGAIEMGQGVNTKIFQVAEKIFSIQPERITIGTTNTYRITNTSPSAASTTADLNGKATEMACLAIMNRLREFAASSLDAKIEEVVIHHEKVWHKEKDTGITWEALIGKAYLARISLSEHAHYATPQIYFDGKIEKGHPFAYHVYGTALTEVTVDCIRGTYEIDAVEIVHDVGKSMNRIVDMGQMEGGVVQGIGWMTMEEIVYDNNGKLRSNALSTYKVPDIYSAPKLLNIKFRESDKDNLAIFHSKAVGEPPLMYGIGTFFALRNAIKAFNPNSNIGFSAPMTPEKTLMGLYGNKS